MEGMCGGGTLMTSDLRSYWTRRALLQGSLGAGAFLLGMQGGLPQAIAAPDFKLNAQQPGAKRGGILRYGVLSAPAHFDVHQSGTVSNMGTQGCMYDNLIRRNPLDAGKTIIPDLAHSWEISPDNKTYTFFLRKGVTFHDGADFTAEDVKATYDRIRHPPTGVSIPRTPLFSTISEINVRDTHTVEFKLSEARPQTFMLAAFASGWNIIVRKKTLEDNNYNLRQIPDFPGTGPFKHVKRVDKEVWIMEKNKNYWNEGLPYLDGVEVYHLPPFSAQLAGALLAGKIDYARALDPTTVLKIKDTQGLSSHTFYQSVIHAVWVNNRKKPYDDPRVRRALHLVFDRPTLVEVAKEITPTLVGGFIYPFSEFATPPAKMTERLGYQNDPTAAIKEARQLLAAAGYPNGLKNVDFMVRDIAHFKRWSEALQAILKETINVECNLRSVQVSVWFDEAEAGNYDLTISAIVSTLLDPSDYFSSWYAKDGPQNYARWSNQAFEELLPQINRETDAKKRQTLITQAEMLMEQDPPLLPVVWERLNDGWHNYVKGHNPDYFGIYDVVRFDTMWFDK